VLGRYRIEHELGAGAIGVVHAAFDPDLERRIALKVLRRTRASDETRQRLLREARAMARLAHPNVVTVYEVGTVAGRDFIAMELIHGETLADWLASCTASSSAGATRRRTCRRWPGSWTTSSNSWSCSIRQ
jgi:serine/threonine protein kinase